MFWSGVVLASIGQIVYYVSTKKDQQAPGRTFALCLALAALVLSAAAAKLAVEDWSKLPKSSVGLRPGQLYNNDGLPGYRGKRQLIRG
jgi:hypothetical protein